MNGKNLQIPQNYSLGEIRTNDAGGKSTPDQDYADVLSSQPSAIMLSLTAVS